MNTARSFDLDRAGPRVTLQRHSYQQPVCDLSKHFQVVSNEPSSHQQCGASMPSTASGQNRRTMGERISSALWRRVNKTITRKQLQNELGISEGTMEKLLAGRGDPSARVIDDLLRVLDADFGSEIFADIGIVILKPAEATRKVAEGLEELSRADPTTLGLFAEVFAKMKVG